jgi:nicotinamidase-related amidase
MSATHTALLLVDAQESFPHRPCWRDADLHMFADRLQALIGGARLRNIPIPEVFHAEHAGPFFATWVMLCVLERRGGAIAPYEVRASATGRRFFRSDE